MDDVVAKSESKGSVAAVARDDEGKFLGCSQITMDGISDPATLECLACREALALACDLNIQRLKISTVCLEVARSLQDEADDKGRYGKIISECVRWARQFTEAIFCHEGRMMNEEAHRLARSAILNARQL